MNNFACFICGSYFCDRRCHIKPMPTEPTPVPAPQPSLRKAASEALLAGALALADMHRALPQASNGWTDAMKATEERFRKALEQLAEELGK